MNISITPDLLPFVDQLVASGNYSSPDAAVCDALKQMRDRQSAFDKLKESLQEASDEIDRGEGVSFDVEEILAEGRRMLAERQNR